jgi:hypothetical protein
MQVVPLPLYHFGCNGSFFAGKRYGMKKNGEGKKHGCGKD